MHSEHRIHRTTNNIWHGLWQNSNDRTISKDINALSKQYHAMVSMPEKTVLPYFVLSRNYNEQSRDFELFIGSVIDKSGLESCILPAGEYAKITVKPKLGFLWGVSIGDAKQYFYKKWLPKGPFEALNLEYEYHTERSKEKQPTIDIIFAIDINCSLQRRRTWYPGVERKSAEPAFPFLKMEKPALYH